MRVLFFLVRKRSLTMNHPREGLRVRRKWKEGKKGGREEGRKGGGGHVFGKVARWPVSQAMDPTRERG